jgi:acyl carrier protein
MTTITTIAALQNILHEGFGIEPDAMTRDTRLEDLGVDSLRTIEILFQVEDVFGIRIPSVQEQPTQTLTTVGDVVDLIDRLVAQKASAQGTS